MRAVRVHEVGGPEVLRVDDIPDPTPAAGELLIDVEAIGVNFIEIYQREGLYHPAAPVHTRLGSRRRGARGRRRRLGLQGRRSRRLAEP